MRPAHLAAVVATGTLTLVAVMGVTAIRGPGSPAATRQGTDGTSVAAASESPEGHGEKAGGRGRLVDVEGTGTGRPPVAVRVPSIGLESRLDTIGVAESGVLETPPRWEVPGWYDGGPHPGDTGPAVIAGHVDSPTGPAVFARLDELRPGDLVEVEDAAGRVVRFRVDRSAEAPRDAFPTQAVYGPTPDPQLRLITCSGDYDAAAGGYQDNLIVFATAVTT